MKANQLTTLKRTVAQRLAGEVETADVYEAYADLLAFATKCALQGGLTADEIRQALGAEALAPVQNDDAHAVLAKLEQDQMMSGEQFADLVFPILKPFRP